MTFLMIMLWLIGLSVVMFGVGWLMFRVADWMERGRAGVPLTAERGEEVGRRVGLTFAVIVFIALVTWYEVLSQVVGAALISVLAFMLCYAPIAGSAKGRAQRLKRQREEHHG